MGLAALKGGAASQPWEVLMVGLRCSHLLSSKKS